MPGTLKGLQRSPRSLRSLPPLVLLALLVAAGAAAPAQAGRTRSAAVRGMALAKKLARRNIAEPRLEARNERWGWLTRFGARRKARTEAHRQVQRFVDQAHAKGRLDDQGAKRLRSRMRRRLDQSSLAEVMAGEANLATGRRGWWSMLRRVTGAESQPFSRLELLVDGPAFRAAAHDLVARASGFLHISGLEWSNDTEGRALATGIAARKLRMQPEQLERMLRTRSLGEIRDQRLAEAQAARDAGVDLDRPLPAALVEKRAAEIARMPERERVALVGRLLEPLEVRVLLSAMFQFKDNRGRMKQPHLRDLERVGAQVQFEHMPVQKRFPFLMPQNLYAQVTHGKMVASGDEAVAGGQNYGDKYMQPAGGPLTWHDASAAIQGKVVHGYTQSFLAHWNRTARAQGRREMLVDDQVTAPSGREPFYFPRPRGPPRGEATIIGTDTRIGTERATYSYRTSLRLALAGARDSVIVSNPYFTSPFVAGELAQTARRFRREGRDPSRIVLLLTKAADETLASSFLTNHYVHQLKKLGVTVLEFAPDAEQGEYIDGAINHTKAWVVDGRVAYVGSANLTVRSMTQDWEMGVVTGDPRFVRQVESQLMARDRARSRPAKSLWAPVRYLGYGLSLLLGPLLRAT